MKISIAISILIFAALGFVGWENQKRISEITVTKATLSAEAAALGISLNENGTVKIQRGTKSARADKEAEAHQAAKDFIAFAKEMEAFKDGGEKPDEEMQKRMMDFMDRMLSLDADQLKILIAEFRASTELKDESRNGMIMFAIMTLASDHPEAALAIFTESQDLIENGMMSKHLLSSSLANWASKDPAAALDWVRKNSEKHSDIITDDVKAGLVKGAAQNDMRLAFDLIAELKMDTPDKAFENLARSANTEAKRTEFFALLRDKEKSLGEKGDEITRSAISNLADGIAKDGFEKGSRWISENKLSQEDIDSMGSTLGYNSKGADKGKWIEWMGTNVSEEKRGNVIENAMQQWTSNDYRAAGEWLAKTPEGPTREASVSSYARTVAAYDPQTATQWALTLPVGEKRDSTIQSIYQNWPQKTDEDKSARQAFKEEHGIK